MTLSLRVLAERIDEVCLSAARQAGSIDPVRRSVVEPKKTVAERLRATRGTRRDGDVRKNVQPKGIPGNHARWGSLRFVRAGGP